jgi:adenine phosphoribosyltransferase
MSDYKRLIREYAGFPKEGILFKDINPLLSNREALQTVSNDLAKRVWETMPSLTKVVCVEARGFLLGGILSVMLHAGCVPVRKKGKLPPYSSVETADYALEYGTNSISMDLSLLEYQDKIVIVDDVLATGGTAEAVYRILAQGVAKGYLAPFETKNICFAFLLEIAGLKGRQHLCESTQIESKNIISLIHT